MIWTPAEIKLLGTDTDAAIADELGRSPGSVERKRNLLGIPPHKPHSRTWTKRELAKLGTVPDSALAAELGISRRCVLMKRNALGIAPYSPANVPKHLRRKLNRKRAAVTASP